MTGADRIAVWLAGQGVARAFGIPGNQLNPLLFAMRRHGVELIIARHEGGAALAAEAFARLSREIGVCITIPGAGVANALAGISEAYNNCTPLLLLTVHQDSLVPESEYRTRFHGLEHRRTLEAVTQHMETVREAVDLAPALDRALQVLRAERPGPVLIEVSPKVFSSESQELGGGEPERAPTPGLPATAEEAIDRAAARIRGARSPMILAGEGVHFAQASSELLALARRLRAPVATTTLGKGAISEYEPHALGSFTDMLRAEPRARKLLRDADLLLAIGVLFTETDTERWTLEIPCPIVQLDADPRVIGKPYACAEGVVAPLRPALQRLLEALGDAPQAELDERVRQARSERERELHTPLLDALQAVVPEQTTLVADINIDADHALARYKVRDSTSFLFPGVSLLLGYAIPAAIGAAFARPGAKIVALCGDGGFLMAVPDLATAVKYGLDVAFVIVNDDAYGTIKYRQLREYGETIGADLRNPDFVALARAFGVAATRVDRRAALQDALAQAVATHGPTVLEIDKRLLLNA